MNIYIFTGLSASGKSILSRAFAERLEIPRVDLRAIIHEKAGESGFDRGRDWIRSVGTEKVFDR